MKRNRINLDWLKLGEDIFDASVGGSLAPAFGASDCPQAAGMDAGISQNGSDPCYGFHSQGCNCPPYLGGFSILRPWASAAALNFIL